MPVTPALQQAHDRETLLYFVMVRQLETDCPYIQAAYQGLADAVLRASDRDLRSVILDWIDAEVTRLRSSGERSGDLESLPVPKLMKDTVTLSHAIGPCGAQPPRARGLRQGNSG